MALRWTAAAFAAASKEFRRIMGHEHLGMLKAALQEPGKDRSLVQPAAAGKPRNPAGQPNLFTERGTSSKITNSATA
jgi:hypothetical protein